MFMSVPLEILCLYFCVLRVPPFWFVFVIVVYSIHIQFEVSGYSLSDLVQEAQHRWLKPPEVLFILQNYEDSQLTDKPLQKPPGTVPSSSL